MPLGAIAARDTRHRGGMWSAKYTGSAGIVNDSYQRIALHVPVQVFVGGEEIDKISTYISQFNLRHIIIQYTVDSGIDVSVLSERIVNLLALTTKEIPLVFTIEIIGAVKSTQSDTLIRTIIDACDINALLLRKKHDLSREEFMTLLQDTASHVAKSIRQPHLGFSGIPDADIQRYLDLSTKFVSVVHVGEHCYPNLKCRLIDLIHSRGCNVIIAINDTSNPLSGLQSFHELHDKPKDIILLKALLQLGAIVSYGHQVDASFLSFHAFSYAHPFTELPVYYAPTKNCHFALTNKEIERIVEASDAEEFKELYSPEISTQPPPKVELTFDPYVRKMISSSSGSAR